MAAPFFGLLFCELRSGGADNSLDSRPQLMTLEPHVRLARKQRAACRSLSDYDFETDSAELHVGRQKVRELNGGVTSVRPGCRHRQLTELREFFFSHGISAHTGLNRPACGALGGVNLIQHPLNVLRCLTQTEPHLAL